MADNSNAVLNDGAQGAAAGSVAGPYGAAIGGAAGVIGGLIGSSQSLPTVDVGQLLATIAQSGQDVRTVINQMPAAVQQQIAAYQAANGQSTAAYQTGIQNTGAAYAAGMNSIYGPNTAAANAEKDADRTSIYSTVPGTQDAIRNAMAATGGLERGNAGVQLAQPYINAAQQYGQAAAGVDAKQTASGQGATAQALTAVNNMDAQMFQQTYGMSQAQAQQILTTGNQALQTQLADLINQTNTQTNQTLGVEGLAANNGYQNAVTRNQQQGAIYNGLAGIGLDAAGNYLSTPSSSNVGMDTSSADYQTNAAANSPL